MAGRSMKQKSAYNKSLFALSILIILLSTWSIICSHLFINTTSSNSGSLYLQSPNNLQSKGQQSRRVDANSAGSSLSSAKEPKDATKLNSQIYNPAPPTNTSRRFLTYARHGGRLNNQLIQFIGAIQTATVLKRKLIVPDEKVAVEWTGLLDDHFEIWDLSSLKQEYDIDWELGLDFNKEKAEKERVLHSQIPTECVLSKFQLGDLLNGGPEHWKKWDEKCPDIMSLGHELPLCSPKHSFCGDSEAKSEAYKIYQHLKLSQFMQSLLPPPKPLSVHSRRAGEGGYDWEICTNPTRTVCSEHIEKRDHSKYCNERTLRGNCAIWTDLSYAIKSKRIWRQDEKEYRFNLASDGTHDWSIDYNGQFTMANSTPWLTHMDEVVLDRLNNQKRTLLSLGRSSFIRERLGNQSDLLSKSQGIMYQLSSTILEMFSLVNSGYFVGGFYSTLSLNVCLLRGLHRLNDSNMCWLLIHPDSKYAVAPPAEDTINIPTDGSDAFENIPPALMSDVEHAFISSNDGKFFVIDRYRFMFKQSAKGKIPTYIAVLGQGEVPMTIEKQASGEVKIHANFTCSMGNQKSKATVHILSDGDSSAKDNPQTLFIVCDDLKYDNDVTIQPPLTLQSPDGFSVSIGSHLVGARNAPRKSWDGSIPTYEILNCLMPTDEEIDSGWLQSFLKHHTNIGVKTHVHIYNVNWHSGNLQSIMNAYRVRQAVSRHDWSIRAKSKSSAHETFVHNFARPAAKMDCMLRSRGVDSYATFGDIKEMMYNSAAADLKACQDNSAENCLVEIDVAPYGLVKGDESYNITDVKREKKECVNIKNVELAPWTLI
ncbi:hypothetical protein ACHAWO_001014 [Cyclotella atomus]|uniref:Uncharacterized protein n=1 Tax=Cyclotella atomus TaxID=382360 RepID=A0ABD3PEI2_9STRA